MFTLKATTNNSYSYKNLGSEFDFIFKAGNENFEKHFESVLYRKPLLNEWSFIHTKSNSIALEEGITYVVYRDGKFFESYNKKS
jgi:hypothetical protein